MAVREFNGTSDRIVVDDGIVGQLANGAFTLLAVLKPLTAFVGGAHPMTIQAIPNEIIGWNDNGSGRWAISDDDEYIDSAGTSIVTLNNWSVTTLSSTGVGTATRFRGKQLGTGSWVRVNASSNFTGNTIDCTSIEFGSLNNGAFSSFWNGRLAVAAVWNSALSDGQVDGIETAKTTASIAALSPIALWDFNQASVGTAVTDLTGNGSNETTRSGTTVVTTDDPPGWTFGVSSAVITPPFYPIMVGDQSYQDRSRW